MGSSGSAVSSSLVGNFNEGLLYIILPVYNVCIHVIEFSGLFNVTRFYMGDMFFETHKLLFDL